jgi:hypothetical protein
MNALLILIFFLTSTLAGGEWSASRPGRFVYLSLCSPLLDLSRFSVSLSFTQSVGLLGGGSARRKAATYTQHNTENKRTQTSVPSVGFEPTIPALERAETAYASDRAATVNY